MCLKARGSPAVAGGVDSPQLAASAVVRRNRLCGRTVL